MENTEKKQPLVQVKNLCKYFEISRKDTFKAVDDLTFDMYKGETVSLVGESGCGKSTTGRTMIKLYNPTSGNVYYDGKDIFKYNHAEQKEFCKKVQMIFQNPYSSLNPRMTVKDIVGEGLKQLPFGIHKMCIILIPKGYDVGGTIGMIALSVIVGGLLGSLMIPYYVVRAFYVTIRYIVKR